MTDIDYRSPGLIRPHVSPSLVPSHLASTASLQMPDSSVLYRRLVSRAAESQPQDSVKGMRC